MYDLFELKEKIENLKLLISEENDEDDEKIQEDFFSISNELEELSNTDFKNNDYKVFKELQRELKEIKEGYDFYDAEGELDIMFPDRHEEDFDEDAYYTFD